MSKIQYKLQILFSTNGKVYNLGTGRQTSLHDIFNSFESIFNKSIKYSYAQERKGDIKYSYANIDELTSLGYKPEYSVRRGLEEYINSNK